jgi:hypothetical protein
VNVRAKAALVRQMKLVLCTRKHRRCARGGDVRENETGFRVSKEAALVWARTSGIPAKVRTVSMWNSLRSVMLLSKEAELRKRQAGMYPPRRRRPCIPLLLMSPLSPPRSWAPHRPHLQANEASRHFTESLILCTDTSP